MRIATSDFRGSLTHGPLHHRAIIRGSASDREIHLVIGQLHRAVFLPFGYLIEKSLLEKVRL